MINTDALPEHAAVSCNKCVAYCRADRVKCFDKSYEEKL